MVDTWIIFLLYQESNDTADVSNDTGVLILLAWGCAYYNTKRNRLLKYGAEKHAKYVQSMNNLVKMNSNPISFFMQLQVQTEVAFQRCS